MSVSILKRFSIGCLLFLTLISLLWSCAAIGYDAPLSPGLKIAVQGLLISATLVSLFRIRPLARASILPLTLTAMVLIWWLRIEPSNDRDWAPEYANLPSVEIDGEIVTIHNLRCFRYRSPTDFEQKWETRTYDLKKLIGIDLVFSHWGSPYIAHTIMSWQFTDSKPLAISIETRREKGETYSSTRGFFRQYELYYVVADETDVLKLRTNYRGEQVYLYRLRANPRLARKILMDYFHTINRLNSKPGWYNAFTQNCTTTIHHHVKSVAENRPWTWKLLVNGYLPQLGHQRGSMNNSLPFEEIQKRSLVSGKALSLSEGDDYSTGIRKNLPARPEDPLGDLLNEDPGDDETPVKGF